MGQLFFAALNGCLPSAAERSESKGENPMLINVAVRGCPADDGAVVLELAREGRLLAGLAGRASPLAVVEYDCGEVFVANRSANGASPPALIAPMPCAITTAGCGPSSSGR